MKFKIVDKSTGKFFAALGEGLTSEERAYHFTKEEIVNTTYFLDLLLPRKGMRTPHRYSHRLKLVL